MHDDDIIEIKDLLTQIIGELSEIKNIIKQKKQLEESKLPRLI